MKIKKCLSIVLILSMIICIGSVSAQATTMSPMYTNISSVDNDLYSSGKTLYVSAGTYGYLDVDKCGVTATLQKLSGSSWANYKVWTATSPSSHPYYVTIDTSIVVTTGTYRLVSSHSVTMDPVTEYEGITSNNVIIS